MLDIDKVDRDPGHRSLVLDRAMRTRDMDNERFLRKVRERLDRCAANPKPSPNPIATLTLTVTLTLTQLINRHQLLVTTLRLCACLCSLFFALLWSR